MSDAGQAIATEVMREIGEQWGASRRSAVRTGLERVGRNALERSRGEAALRLEVRELTEDVHEALLRAACRSGREAAHEQICERLRDEPVHGLYARVDSALERCEGVIEAECAKWVGGAARDAAVARATRRLARERARQPIADARGWRLTQAGLRALGRMSESAWRALASGPAWLARASTMGLGPRERDEPRGRRAWRLARKAGRHAAIAREASEEDIARVLAYWAWEELDPPLASVWVHAGLGTTIEGDEEWGAAIRKRSCGSSEEWDWKVRRKAHEDWRTERRWIERDAWEWLRRHECGAPLDTPAPRTAMAPAEAKQRLSELARAWALAVRPERAGHAPRRRLGALAEEAFKHMHPVWTVPLDHAATALWASAAVHGWGEAPSVEKTLGMLVRHRSALLDSRRAGRSWKGDRTTGPKGEGLARTQARAAREALEGATERR